MTKKDLDVIQEKIGYKFNEQYLLVQAFTRKTFTQENRGHENNERLEFVGDKVIDFIVVKKQVQMYGFKEEKALKTVQVEKARDFNFIFSYTEGEMTEMKKRIVQTSFFAKSIEHLELEKYLLMGKGDTKNNVQNESHVKEDLFEAIIGAIAIDSCWNMEILESVVERLLDLENSLKNQCGEKDYISYVHNWHQKMYGKAPEYEFDDSGNDDVFLCYLDLNEYVGGIIQGYGKSKKEAMKSTAKRVYEFLREKQTTGKKFFEIIGSFSFEDAVNKLQMLQDKKMISGLEYIFREGDQTESNNGNPMWYCQCKVDGIDDYIEYGDFKKANAKKASAFTMLEILTTGRDKIGEKIAEEFYKENNILNTLTDGGNNDEQ